MSAKNYSQSAAVSIEDLVVSPANAELRGEIERLRVQAAVQPGNVRVRLGLAQALAAAGAFVEAASTLRGCIEIAGDPGLLAGVFFNLGVCREQVGELEGAESAYEQALLLCPQMFWARLRRAVLLDRLGRTEAAVRELTLASSIETGDPEAHFALAEALRDQGRLREARSAYLQVTRECPADLAAWQALRQLDSCLQ